ncbi:hypothetical protein LBMAG42_41820 [Deltaproteobacteria bacterium]|nr:hypothetical protein LBMAG42_41820 [Deltaproteobacteria bacterium]
MIAFLLACDLGDPVDACEPFEAASAQISAAGTASWDPYLATMSDDEDAWTATPVAAGASGLLTLEPLEIPDILPAEAGVYRPNPERAAGEYVTVGGWATPTTAAISASAHDPQCPDLRAPSWTELGDLTVVEPFGRDPAFEPSTLVQSRHLLTPALAFVGASPALGGLVGGAGPFHLEVLDVADGAATFRLVSKVYGTTDECVLLQDQAQLSATGELTWSRDRIDAETEPAPLTLYSPSIRLGFLGDRAAGGEVMTLADVRATAGTELDLCDLAGSFGVDCQPCPDDGNPSCLPVSGFGWTAAKVDEPIDLDLPWCGVDFSDPDNVPEWNFDFTCQTDGLCAASALGLVLPLVWRRRRR